MHKPLIDAGRRIGVASLTLLLALASFHGGAGAATTHPTAPAGNAFTPEENFVTWVYWSVLFREPEQEGLTYWTDQIEQHGTPAFVHAVVGSAEWRETWVNDFYQHWLDRAADDEGRGFWADYLAGNRFDGFESFLGGSDETYEVGGGTDEGYIDYVYHLATFRGPTEAELAEGLAMLAMDHPLSNYVASVLHSGDGMASRVEIAYETALGREPDPDGSMFWMGYYHHTGSMHLMLAYMLLSPEAWEAAQNPPTNRADLRSLLER